MNEEQYKEKNNEQQMPSEDAASQKPESAEQVIREGADDKVIENAEPNGAAPKQPEGADAAVTDAPKANADATSPKATAGASSVTYGPEGYRKQNVPTKKKKSGRTLALILSLTIVGSLLFGFGGILLSRQMTTWFSQGDNSSATDQGGKTPVQNTVVMKETSATAATLADGTIPAVVQKCAPSVVEIITKAYAYGGTTETVSGAGSGVIIAEDEDGTGTYIVTNNHVVEGNNNSIVVRTNTGAEYTAQIVGMDWQSDIAVLRIEKSGLTVATWADSTKLLQGQDVVVIGNPLGALGGSVTRGILSGVERTITIEGVPMQLLQIDAAVNPGNSGGGLFDMNGNLIGIVNAKTVGTNIEGLGYAIPSSYAKQMAYEIASKGYVSGRVDLGFTFSNTSLSGGLVISNYSYESSTEILSGDILVKLELSGGKAVLIESIEDYRNALCSLKAGDTVTATIGRIKQYGLWSQTNYYTVTLTAQEISS